MTTPADTTVYDITSWEDLQGQLRVGARAATVLVGRDGPVITLDQGGLLGGRLWVTDPRDQLRAQDRRRLHRLGLRPQSGTAARRWTWQAPSPEPPPGACASERFRAGIQASLDDIATCRTQFLTVLREGLRLQPARLTLVIVEEDMDDWEEEPVDDSWDDDGDEVS